jgi:hypothetical protein
MSGNKSRKGDRESALATDGTDFTDGNEGFKPEEFNSTTDGHRCTRIRSCENMTFVVASCRSYGAWKILKFDTINMALLTELAGHRAADHPTLMLPINQF